MHITSPPRKRKALESSENECSPEQLRLVGPKKKLLSVQKPEATVIATGSASTAPLATTPDTSPLPSTPPPSTLRNAETPKSSQPVQLTPAVLTPNIKYSVPAIVTKLNQKMDVMSRGMLTLEALHQQTHQQKIHATLQQVLLILQHTPITHGSADIAPVQQQEHIQLTVPPAPTFRPANVFTFETPVRSQSSNKHFLHIPEQHRIPDDQLENKYHLTKCSGNFAQHIMSFYTLSCLRMKTTEYIILTMAAADLRKHH